LLPGRRNQAGRPGETVNPRFTIIGRLLPLVGGAVPFIGRLLPPVGRRFPGIGGAVPLIGQLLSLAGRPLSSAGGAVPRFTMSFRRMPRLTAFLGVHVHHDALGAAVLQPARPRRQRLRQRLASLA
jgi:hypothetical protein